MNMQPLMGQTRCVHLDELKPWNSARQMLVCLSVADEAGCEDLHLRRRRLRLVPLCAGQFITVELRAKGGDLHRTYTISSTPSRPYALSITVKAQPNSIGTRWMFNNIKPAAACVPTARQAISR